jgi:FkbM family methyltransferase
MKKVLLDWLRSYSPTVWLAYIHKNQIPFFNSWPCEYELKHISKIPIRERAIAIDIGANIGSYSFAFSKRLGFDKVFSVEPDSTLHSYITRIPKVTLISEALSDNESIAVLSVPVLEGVPLKSRSTLCLDTLASFEEINSYEVCCTTLDSMMVKKQINPLLVGIVKIDVEGNEFQTLIGGKEFLRATNATLLIEIEARHHENRSVIHIFDFLLEFNFVPHYLCRVDCELKAFVIADIEKFQKEENIGTMGYINNFIFIKRK